MTSQQTVLLLGGTGRTGRRALRQLLDRGVRVRAIVRSAGRLPPEVVGHASLELIEANLPSMSDEELRRHLGGCDAVVSCPGHVLSFGGVLGPPRDLVTSATRRLCRGIRALEPAAPVKLVLMSSVSVHRARGLDARRGRFERLFLWVLRGHTRMANVAHFLCELVTNPKTWADWKGKLPVIVDDHEASGVGRQRPGPSA